MNPIEVILARQNIAILDGGLATELERKGYSLKGRLWSARLLQEAPDAIRRVHLDYLIAGADIISTSSYQATIPGFKAQGISDTASEILLRLSFGLAEEALKQYIEAGSVKVHFPVIAASIGPFGAYLADGSEYIGNYTISDSELMDFHRPRMEILYDAGARLFAFETIPDKKEAVLLCNLLKEFPDAYAWLSLSCRDNKRLSDGTLLREIATEAAQYHQIAAIGVNCTPVTLISSLIEELKSSTTKPIIVYPNSGEVWNAAQHRWEDNACSDNFANQAKIWISQGANIIGGCCRINPQQIHELTSLRVRR
jgi:homocysteine S-methyltransferase